MRDLPDRRRAREYAKLSAWCKREVAHWEMGWELLFAQQNDAFMWRRWLCWLQNMQVRHIFCMVLTLLHSFALFCTLLHSFALFCVLWLYRGELRFVLHHLITTHALSHSFTLCCTLLHSFGLCFRYVAFTCYLLQYVWFIYYLCHSFYFVCTSFTYVALFWNPLLSFALLGVLAICFLSFALFCTLLHSFALFCTPLRSVYLFPLFSYLLLSFALFWTIVKTFALSRIIL